MINLNKYTDLAAYNSATNRPANENCTSLAGNDVIYDGVNIILKQNQIKRDDVCLVFWDNTEDEYVFVPVETYVASKMDTTRYTVQNFIRFTRSNGKDVLMHNDRISGMWAEHNRYKLYCDTTAAGGFTWAVSINFTEKGGTVTWAANDTLDSIVSQMNTQGAVTTHLVFSHETGEDFIRIRKGGITNSIFTLSNVTGAILDDLSMYVRIDGVQQPNTHRDWQSQNVDELFPSSGFIPNNEKLYARNGYNLSYMCGENLERYKTNCDANGSSTYVSESTIAARMTSSAFAALNNSGVSEQQALYDKYAGSWDAYIEASMVQIDDIHKDGMEYQSYDDGTSQTTFLTSVTTMDFDGTYIPAYPCAYATRQKTSTRGDLVFSMPTLHELAVFMEDSTYTKIRTAMTATSGFLPANTSYYWSAARSSSRNAYAFEGGNGQMTITNLYYTLYCRPLAYLTAPEEHADEWYGVTKDRSVLNSALTRIGNEDLHRSLPVQSCMRRCVLRDNGSVAYYLDPTDSTKKADGTAANLDGTDGQVMVEIPEHYQDLHMETDPETGHSIEVRRISMFPLRGFTKVNKCYYSAFEAALDRTNNKLSSVVNTTAQYRGGNNNSDWDGTYRSLLGMPATAISLTNFRTYASNRGTGWTCHDQNIYDVVCNLYLIEYANTNCQLAFNSTATADGYRQGGLGSGVTNMSNWEAYNSYYPIVPCGVTVSLGNTTGVVTHNVIASDGSTTQYAAPVPSYRGIENPFGHIWKHTDGILMDISSYGPSVVYRCADPTKYSSTITSDYVSTSMIARTSGWSKNTAFPTLIASEVGADSSTGWCDYYYTSLPSSGSALRACLWGGRANYGSYAGLGYADSNYAPSYTIAAIGSRLCHWVL